MTPERWRQVEEIVHEALSRGENKGLAFITRAGDYIRANRNFDISRDGQRFLMIKEATPILEPSARDEITVVVNWSEELKRLVPPK